MKLKDSIALFAKGGVIGVANIIPGVSGGTMAVVLGIYERLMEAVGNVLTDKERRKSHIVFLSIVGVGALAAIGALSFLMDYLLTEHPSQTYLFFIGLIIGSIPSVYRAHSDMQVDTAAILSFLFGAALIMTFALLFPDLEKSKDINFTYSLTAAGALLLLITGFFAGGSMIVPGISGSFIMVLMGQYRIVIKAIKELNIAVLAVVAVGAGLGIWGFAKFIDVMLKKYPRQTIYFILGLIVASCYPIFPGLPADTGAAAMALGLGVVGFGLSIWLGER